MIRNGGLMLQLPELLSHWNKGNRVTDEAIEELLINASNMIRDEKFFTLSSMPPQITATAGVTLSIRRYRVGRVWFYRVYFSDTTASTIFKATTLAVKIASVTDFPELARLTYADDMFFEMQARGSNGALATAKNSWIDIKADGIYYSNAQQFSLNAGFTFSGATERGIWEATDDKTLDFEQDQLENLGDLLPEFEDGKALSASTMRELIRASVSDIQEVKSVPLEYTIDGVKFKGETRQFRVGRTYFWRGVLRGSPGAKTSLTIPNNTILNLGTMEDFPALSRLCPRAKIPVAMRVKYQDGSIDPDVGNPVVKSVGHCVWVDDLNGLEFENLVNTTIYLVIGYGITFSWGMVRPVKSEKDIILPERPSKFLTDLELLDMENESGVLFDRNILTQENLEHFAWAIAKQITRDKNITKNITSLITSNIHMTTIGRLHYFMGEINVPSGTPTLAVGSHKIADLTDIPELANLTYTSHMFELLRSITLTTDNLFITNGTVRIDSDGVYLDIGTALALNANTFVSWFAIRYVKEAGEV